MPLVSINLDPRPRDLMIFGLVLAGAVAMIGLIGNLVESSAARSICLGVGCLLAVLSVVLPKAILPIYRIFVIVTFPIGWVMSHLMLAMIYFGLFTVIGVVFRLLGRDLLQRRADRSASTFWIPREPHDNLERYFKQY